MPESCAKFQSKKERASWMGEGSGTLGAVGFKHSLEEKYKYESRNLEGSGKSTCKKDWFQRPGRYWVMNWKKDKSRGPERFRRNQSRKVESPRNGEGSGKANFRQEPGRFNKPETWKVPGKLHQILQALPARKLAGSRSKQKSCTNVEGS